MGIGAVDKEWRRVRKVSAIFLRIDTNPVDRAGDSGTVQTAAGLPSACDERSVDKMRARRVLAGAATLMAGVLLVGCSSGGDASTPASGESTTQATNSTDATADSSSPAEETDEHSDHDHGDHDHGGDKPAGTALTAEQDGYSLALTAPSVPKGDDVEVGFSIFGPDGKAVTQFDTLHEEKLHLIVVSKDLKQYFHEHPEMSNEGVWTANLPLAADGTYRVIADFVPKGGDHVAVGENLIVGVANDATAELVENRVYEVDGYRAELVGDTMHEDSAPLKFVLTNGGQPVTEVKPYLGAAAHFVAFADDDLAYYHMHPNSNTISETGEITFTAPPMDHKLYKGFIQVDVGGSLKTFEFVWKGE